MQLEANSTHYHHSPEDDLTTLPGWRAANGETRSRIVDGARRYLTERSAGEDWLGTNSTPYMAFAGYQALFLLRKESPALFASLPPQVWTQWAPIVVTFYSAESVQEDQERHTDIARQCATKAPAMVASSIKRIAAREVSDESQFFLPRFVDRVWNNSINQTLLGAATDPATNPKIVGCLFETLLEHGCNDAKAAAKRLLSIPIPTSGLQRARAVMAAKALLRHADDAGWEVVWPAILSDSDFGRTVVEAVAMRDLHNPTIVSRISEAEAAALYIWMTKQYPHASDTTQEGATFVGPKDAVSWYRDTLLRAIQNCGTREAIVALQSIATELPHLAWMKWVIVEARKVTLRASWRPLAPNELLKLVQRPATRLVQSAVQLQDVIIESLADLQIALQGETPAAPDLWDEGSSKRFTPKDENHLSDYVKRHLERDLNTRGIVALREVEIRRGEGLGAGERTDIHVTGIVSGVTPGTFDQVRVIIEVKGTWHDAVETAMASQLADRYLQDNQCQCGIYLVGWYRCGQWDHDSTTFKKSRKETFESARQRFDAQAVYLSNEFRTIKAVVMNAVLR